MNMRREQYRWNEERREQYRWNEERREQYRWNEERREQYRWNEDEEVAALNGIKMRGEQFCSEDEEEAVKMQRDEEEME
jgi:hypothetical protein